jgi:serine/threonine protein kinase
MYLIMRDSSNSNTITIEDAFEDDQKVYFIIENLLGGSLYDHIMHHGHLKYDEVKEITA